jgi:hypothetical protein
LFVICLETYQGLKLQLFQCVTKTQKHIGQRNKDILSLNFDTGSMPNRNEVQ